MPKDEWGVKRLCPKCANRFYDLKRDPMTCPECEHTFTAESLIVSRGRSMVAEKAVPKDKVAEPVDELADDVVIDDDDDADDDLADDLLEDDEDDDVSLDEIADVATPDDDA